MLLSILGWNRIEDDSFMMFLQKSQDFSRDHHWWHSYRFLPVPTYEPDHHFWIELVDIGKLRAKPEAKSQRQDKASRADPTTTTTTTTHNSKDTTNNNNSCIDLVSQEQSRSSVTITTARNNLLLINSE